MKATMLPTGTSTDGHGEAQAMFAFLRAAASALSSPRQENKIFILFIRSPLSGCPQAAGFSFANLKFPVTILKLTQVSCLVKPILTSFL